MKPHPFMLGMYNVGINLCRAVSSEPCFWQAKNMMRQIDVLYMERFQSNPFWMQYAQCHNDWN